MKKICLTVSVEVPDEVNASDVADCLDKFIQIGWNDLDESVNDPSIDVSEHEIAATKFVWGSPVVKP